MPSVGVLDSGVGGLSVLRAIHQHLPTVDTIYFADQRHVPYGPRPHAQIHHFVDAIARYFIAQGVDAVVLACHAASAASLKRLRGAYPDMSFVGIEPAVKPAAQATKTGVIGVLTTQATADGALYQRVVARFAQNVTVHTCVTPELVTLVEDQQTNNSAALQAVLSALPLTHIDQLVLACTHFPFLADAIQAIIGAHVTLVDPGPAVARQVARVIPAAMGQGTRRYVTSGHTATLYAQVTQLLHQTDVTVEFAGDIFTDE
jgi:glutamate racemase